MKTAYYGMQDWEVRAILAGRKAVFRCPANGKEFQFPIGTRIWIQEAWAVAKQHDLTSIKFLQPRCKVRYRADDPKCDWTWRSRRHMPKWASRIVLEVTNTTFQTLRRMRVEDYEAEGVAVNSVCAARDAWIALWELRYGTWRERKQVQVVEFKVLSTERVIV